MKNNYVDARTPAERKEDSEIKSEITTTSDWGQQKLKELENWKKRCNEDFEEKRKELEKLLN